MKEKIIYIFAAFALLLQAGVQAQNIRLNKNNVDEILKAMTLEEKVQLVVGAGNTVFTGIGNTMRLVPGAAGSTAEITRLGIKPTVLADGPAGLRIAPRREGDTDTYFCTGFPIATALACSWNTDLLYEVGHAIGNEAHEYGVDVLLAPGMNLHRDPLCGRNFEYYSEDPLLTGKIAAAFINGVQANGVGTSVKHFAVNNQETNRKDLDVRVSQRAIREMYLRGFEIAIREAKPWTVMSAYNMINGQQCMESRELLTTILRNEWGFKGIVLCDWASPGWRDSGKEIYAGNDLLTPGSEKQQQEILQAIKEKTLDEKDLDVCVTRILNNIVQTPRFNDYHFSNNPDLKAHAETARSAAAESVVLLKNSKDALPLNPEIHKIGLWGISSYDFIAGGTGSGDVNKAYVVSLLDGFQNANYEVNEKVSRYYQKEKEKAKAKQKSFRLGQPSLAEISIDKELIKESAETDDVAILTIGRNCGEGADRHIDDDFNLTEIEQTLLSDVCEAFHNKGKKVIVIMNISAVIETDSWKNKPDAILLTWLLGQEGGNAVVDVLTGKSNPSGKVAMTFPIHYSDCNTHDNFPYDYVGPKAIGNYPKIPHPARKNIHYVDYDEDIYVGYRYFNTFKKEVSYPFGYGLSYTKFEYSNCSLKVKDNLYIISVDITNSGDRSGKESIQVYAAPSQNRVKKPLHGLVAFGKTGELAPGETQTVSITFTDKELARFDESRSAWILDADNYQLQIAASSRDIRSNIDLNVQKEKVIETTNNVLKKRQ